MCISRLFKSVFRFRTILNNMSSLLQHNDENTITNNHCKHYVLRKKRFCRMTVKSGFEYCGEHQPKVEITENNIISDPRVRITCPLDNKHTCYASKLEKHLTKCNAQKTVSAPYIVLNINIGATLATTKSIRQLSSVPTNEIKQIIEKVSKIFKDVITAEITTNVLCHEILNSEIDKTEYGPSTRKHLIQTSSLLGHVKNANFLEANTCFVEFGAGKGQLSYWLSQIINNTENKESSVLLVERASLRHKLDNKLDKTKTNVHRIRADIADLVLEQVDVVKKSTNVVGVTKHLCGDATDLAVRCLINGMKNGINVEGLVMAFCCHHRCQWTNFVGQKFFERNNLTKEDFDVICGLVSWATCGSGLSREARKNKEAKTDLNQEIKMRDEEIGLSREEKESIGKKCKLLIDYARLDFLRTENFCCKLFYYVEQDVTLENVCIVANQQNKSPA